MTKKEEKPDTNRQRQDSENQSYDSRISSEDKKVLNNQSYDEKSDSFEDRREPIDYTSSNLDIPEMDDKQFNQTKNKADEEVKNRRPKESANSNNNIESQSETIYKGREAEKYKDPSKKDQKNR